MGNRRALITGITGQDGSYLSEYLLELGYEVHGLVRRVALEDHRHRLHRIEHLLDRLILHSGSVENYPSIFRLLASHPFDECYHLAAQSFVGEDFEEGFATMSINISSTQYILSSIRELQPQCRFYFAGSSEMFGRAAAAPQDEETRFRPRSSYGISKVAGFELTRNYREAYDMFACSGILFNHESPRRGFEFVTKKIASGVALIAHGAQDHLTLGNLDAQRDWGHAADYVQVMWLMLQQDAPDDYVVATGQLHTVREFCELAFAQIDRDYRDHVRVDPRFFRPTEDIPLCGNAQKARSQLGWQPQRTFPDLVREMVEHELYRRRSELNSSRQTGLGS
ncbi:MAG: GDP-mannose 4,6-dehydratase [Planctomycetales bacterium]|nr:GDP-mannose 4,6-dehydratase [Planctomycetales bacterium]